jgi:hypothetical protein
VNSSTRHSALHYPRGALSHACPCKIKIRKAPKHQNILYNREKYLKNNESYAQSKSFSNDVFLQGQKQIKNFNAQWNEISGANHS